jgi:signal transduction histidine kinase
MTETSTLPTPGPDTDPHEIIDRALSAAREMTGMDLAFVGQFHGDAEIIRRTDGDAERFGLEVDDGPSLEDSYCQRMTDGRLSRLVPDTSAEPEVRDLPITEESNLGAYLGVPLRLPDGRLYGAFCCVSEDAATHLDTRHVEMMQMLARLVGDQIGLLEATEQARLAQEEIFAAFGHDVRNPLAPIVAYAELLRSQGRGDPLVAEAAEAIVRNVQRLEEMLDGMLLLVRHRADALEPSLQPVDLAALVSTAVADVRPAAEKRDILLAHSAPVGPVRLEGDPGLLRRVVDNLVSNAIKYSHDGGPVRIILREEGAHARLDVRDQGIGISERERGRLFERFYRTGEARARGIAGTGLGLSICHAIVCAHGGEIDVFSEEGRGSTFTVRLPLARD